MGRVSKQMLDRIKHYIRAKTKPNQWTSTTEVINWFTKLPDKSKLTFLVYDIVDFYPSITRELLTTCLKWARKYTKITEVEFEIFGELELKITTQTNLKVVDYLDITLNLTSETYQPFTSMQIPTTHHPSSTIYQ